MKNILKTGRRIARMHTSGLAGNREFAFLSGAFYEFQEPIPEFEKYVDGVRGEWIDEDKLPANANIVPLKREHVMRGDVPTQSDAAPLDRVAICKRFRWSNDTFDIALRLGFPKPVALRGRQTFTGSPIGDQVHVWAPADVDRWRADVEDVASALAVA